MFVVLICILSTNVSTNNQFLLILLFQETIPRRLIYASFSVSCIHKSLCYKRLNHTTDPFLIFNWLYLYQTGFCIILVAERSFAKTMCF